MTRFGFFMILKHVVLLTQGMCYYGIKVCFIMESRYVLLWNQGMF